MRRSGYTLMEVLATVAVIGILAAVAVPSYRRAVERQYWRSAQDVLLVIYAGEQARFELNNRLSYFGPLGPCNGDAACLASWRNQIFVDDPSDQAGSGVAFAVTTSGTTFTATAARGIDGRCMSINELRELKFSSSAAGCTESWTMP